MNSVEEIDKMLADLKGQQLQAAAQFNTINGAIQALEQLRLTLTTVKEVAEQARIVP